MLNNTKISEHGFKTFIVLAFTGTSILNAPGALIGKAKQDAWIAAIISIIISLFIVVFYDRVAGQFGNMTLVGYAHKVMGKKLGKVVSIYFVLFLLFNCSAILWIVGDFITTEILTETPSVVVNALFMLVVVFGCRLGIETIARSSEVLYPWAITGYTILVILVLPNIDIKNLQPVFEAKFISIFHGVLLFETFVPLTLVAFLMIFPVSINNIKEGKKSFFNAVLLSGILVIILTTVTILALGAEWANRATHPSYALAKSIQIANALERIEAIAAMVWIIAMFYKSVLYFYSTVVGFAEIFALKEYKAITLPLGVIVVVLSGIIYPSIVYQMNWDTTTWIPYIFTNAIFIPLMLLVIGRFRDKKR